jgi:hypothetical protein
MSTLPTCLSTSVAALCGTMSFSQETSSPKKQKAGLKNWKTKSLLCMRPTASLWGTSRAGLHPPHRLSSRVWCEKWPLIYSELQTIPNLFPPSLLQYSSSSF